MLVLLNPRRNLIHYVIITIIIRHYFTYYCLLLQTTGKVLLLAISGKIKINLLKLNIFLFDKIAKKGHFIGLFVDFSGEFLFLCI